MGSSTVSVLHNPMSASRERSGSAPHSPPARLLAPAATGDDCSLVDCPKDADGFFCGQHGVCLPTAECQCTGDWEGVACDMPVINPVNQTAGFGPGQWVLSRVLSRVAARTCPPRMTWQLRPLSTVIMLVLSLAGVPPRVVMGMDLSFERNQRKQRDERKKIIAVVGLLVVVVICCVCCVCCRVFCKKARFPPLPRARFPALPCALPHLCSTPAPLPRARRLLPQRVKVDVQPVKAAASVQVPEGPTADTAPQIQAPGTSVEPIKISPVGAPPPLAFARIRT